MRRFWGEKTGFEAKKPPKNGILGEKNDGFEAPRKLMGVSKAGFGVGVWGALVRPPLPAAFGVKKCSFGVRSVDFGSETAISVSRWQKCRFQGPQKGIFRAFNPFQGEFQGSKPPPSPVLLPHPDFGVKKCHFGVRSVDFGSKTPISVSQWQKCWF